MEGLLGKFQTDLGQVSDEIRQLQVQSQTMSTKLKNRRAAENKLGAFVEQMAVSEDLVTSVIESEVRHTSDCSEQTPTMHDPRPSWVAHETNQSEWTPSGGSVVGITSYESQGGCRCVPEACKAMMVPSFLRFLDIAVIDRSF
jgi:hypothetical protein